MVKVFHVMSGYNVSVFLQTRVFVAFVGFHSYRTVLFVLTAFVFLDEYVLAHHIKRDYCVWAYIFTDAVLNLFLRHTSTTSPG